MLTVNHLIGSARCGVAILIVLPFVFGPQPPAIQAILAYLLMIALLLAFPRMRSGDLAGVALLLITGGAFAEALDHGVVGGERLLLAAGAVGAAVLPFRIARLRGFAAANGYRTFADIRDHDRRRQAPRQPTTAQVDMPTLQGLRPHDMPRSPEAAPAVRSGGERRLCAPQNERLRP